MSCVAHPELAVYADGRIVTFGQSPSQFTVRRYDAVAIRSVIQRLSAVAGSTTADDGCAWTERRSVSIRSR